MGQQKLLGVLVRVYVFIVTGSVCLVLYLICFPSSPASPSPSLFSLPSLWCSSFFLPPLFLPVLPPLALPALPPLCPPAPPSPTLSSWYLKLLCFLNLGNPVLTFGPRLNCLSARVARVLHTFCFTYATHSHPVSVHSYHLICLVCLQVWGEVTVAAHLFVLCFQCQRITKGLCLNVPVFLQ